MHYAVNEGHAQTRVNWVAQTSYLDTGVAR